MSSRCTSSPVGKIQILFLFLPLCSVLVRLKICHLTNKLYSSDATAQEPTENESESIYGEGSESGDDSASESGEESASESEDKNEAETASGDTGNKV